MTTMRRTETDLTRFYELFPQPDLARDLFNLVEGHRIDTRIRAAYPGIRRDMDAVQAAMSAESRPELASLPEANAIVEALLQHLIGMESDLGRLAPHTRTVIGEAVGLVDAFPADSAGVADAARLTVRLYELVTDALADPGRWATEQPPPAEGDQQAPDQQATPPPPEGGGGAEDEYTPLELPPFMTPVMEELVQPPQGSPAQREAQAKEGDKTPREDAEQQMDGVMEATRPEAGDGHSADEVAQQAESHAEAPPGEALADAAHTPESEGGGETPQATGI